MTEDDWMERLLRCRAVGERLVLAGTAFNPLYFLFDAAGGETDRFTIPNISPEMQGLLLRVHAFAARAMAICCVAEAWMGSTPAGSDPLAAMRAGYRPSDDPNREEIIKSGLCYRVSDDVVAGVTRTDRLERWEGRAVNLEDMSGLFDHSDFAERLARYLPPPQVGEEQYTSAQEFLARMPPHLRQTFLIPEVTLQ